MNPHLLQLELSPAEYHTVKLGTLLQHMPSYLIARCPLCGATYSAQLNTYSLKYWPRPTITYGSTIFDERGQEVNCSHFVVVHHFINLNGVMPTELDRKTLDCEVPYLLSVFLPDDIESYAVMHALPICRVEEDRFVPRYSVYMITYYSEEPSVLIKRRWEIASGGCMFWGRGLIAKESWDLAKWVRAGKLQWLDPEEPDLPLRAGPVEAFPYVDIQGRRDQPNFYRNGKWEDQSFFGRLKRLMRER
jgi:hypothetical protein